MFSKKMFSLASKARSSVLSSTRRWAHESPSRFRAPLPESLAGINSKVLDDAAMRRILEPDVYVAFREARDKGKALSKHQKNNIALRVREWSQDQGAIGYTHWFSPIRGPHHGTKMETFLAMDFSDNNNLVVGLSGTELFQTETDGSSFPNGGLRVTHAAAAFMAWDLSSPPFIYGENLFIPSAFVSFTGESLDLKTPLLKANEAVNANSVKLLRQLGEPEVERVVSNLGWEQEFFLCDRDAYLKRPDLVACGRTLFGGPASKGQEENQNYFGKMPVRVANYLADCRNKFWELGISADCFHNEVAPSQFEFAPIFTVSSTATDTNILAMDVMRDIAYEHDLAVLFHEKPFAGINGSGKHNNWSLQTDAGTQLYVPGQTADTERRFVAFTAAVLRALHKHGDLFRIGASTAGNDFRLGAQEAPPAIFTLYLGKGLEKHMRECAEGGPLAGYGAKDHMIEVGSSVQTITANSEDRNRTAPFPWCGNRFEFRAVGSNQSCSWPLAMLNTAVAGALQDMTDAVDAQNPTPENMRDVVDDVVRKTIKESECALFSGDGYDSALLEGIAKEHNLFHFKTSPEAYANMTSQKNFDLFTQQGIFTEAEVVARKNILMETFAIEIDIEARTAYKMLRKALIPAAMEDIKAEKASGFSSKGLAKKEVALQSLLDATDALDDVIQAVPEDASEEEMALYFQNKVRPVMLEARKHSDFLEDRMIGYPFPTYDTLLREHH